MGREMTNKKNNKQKRIPPKKVEELLFSCGIPECFDFYVLEDIRENTCLDTVFQLYFIILRNMDGAK